MEIIFNNQKESLSDSVSLMQLMQQKSLDQKTGIAVAVNQKVVPKNNWSDTILKDQDAVLVITATAGG